MFVLRWMTSERSEQRAIIVFSGTPLLTRDSVHRATDSLAIQLAEIQTPGAQDVRSVYLAGARDYVRPIAKSVIQSDPDDDKSPICFSGTVNSASHKSMFVRYYIYSSRSRTATFVRYTEFSSPGHMPFYM